MANRFEPAHASHSIDYVAATLTFAERIQSSDWLQVVEAALACARRLELHHYEDVFGTQFNMREATPGSGEAPTFNFTLANAGVGFSRLDQAGVRLRGFQASRFELKIDASDYIRWSGFQEILTEVIQSLLQFYPTLKANQIRLEYRDRYVDAKAKLGDPPTWALVLKPGDLLTADHVNRTEPWHLHTGWFENDVTGRKRLLNMNVDATEAADNPRSIYIYSLLSTVNPYPGGCHAQNVLADFDDLHSRSKELLGSILAPEIEKRISLWLGEIDK